MSLPTIIALFAAMAVLAAIPGPGTMVVMARSIAHGFSAGAATALGIVAGDFVFIILAVLGMSSLSLLLGELFGVVKYLGAAYLIWLGFKLLFSGMNSRPSPLPGGIRHSASFAAGLMVTLSNPKAILFYMSFFPAFVDIVRVDSIDLLIVLLVAFVTVGGVMLGYAFLASRSKHMLAGSALFGYVKRGSGAVLVGSGVYVAAGT